MPAKITQVSEKITISANNKPDFGKKAQYGFVKIKGGEDALFSALASFENLKISGKAPLPAKQTKQKPYAASLLLSSKRRFQQEEPQ